jgi:hypothetical protein
MLFDGACPLCVKEVGLYQRLAAKYAHAGSYVHKVVGMPIGFCLWQFVIVCFKSLSFLAGTAPRSYLRTFRTRESRWGCWRSLGSHKRRLWREFTPSVQTGAFPPFPSIPSLPPFLTAHTRTHTCMQTISSCLSYPCANICTHRPLLPDTYTPGRERSSSFGASYPIGRRWQCTNTTFKTHIHTHTHTHTRACKHANRHTKTYTHTHTHTHIHTHAYTHTHTHIHRHTHMYTYTQHTLS